MEIDTMRETYAIWISIVVAGGAARSQLTPMFLSNKQHCVQFCYKFYDILRMSYDSIEVIAVSVQHRIPECHFLDERSRTCRLPWHTNDNATHDQSILTKIQQVGDNCELNWTEHRSNCYVDFAQHKRARECVWIAFD